MKIKIFNRNYSVDVLHEDQMNDYSTDMVYVGRCNYVQEIIKISDGSSMMMQKETLIHESLHAIANQLGLSRLQDDEDLIDALSTGFVELILKNPLLIEFIVQDNYYIRDFVNINGTGEKMDYSDFLRQQDNIRRNDE